jgi:hypothetical protein
LAEFKLMTEIGEHFNLVNNTTYFNNLNKGMMIDKSRYSMQQKIPDQFKKLKLNYNNKNNIDYLENMSNFVTNQLGQVGYKYGF